MRFVLVVSQRGFEKPAIEWDRELSPQQAHVWNLDYVGDCAAAWQHDQEARVSVRSEGGGQSQALMTRKALELYHWDYLIGVPHDVYVRVSDLASAVHLARRENFAAFAMAQTHHSFNSYEHMRQQPGRAWHEVPFVENSCTGFRRDIAEALLPYYDECLSGCGVDCFALPWVAERAIGGGRLAVIDLGLAHHCEPNRSSTITYRGRTTAEEMEGVRLKVQAERAAAAGVAAREEPRQTASEALAKAHAAWDSWTPEDRASEIRMARELTATANRALVALEAADELRAAPGPDIIPRPLSLRGSPVDKPTLHLILPFHTLPIEAYSHCAFTSLARSFPHMIAHADYECVVYGNGDGANLQACRAFVTLLSAGELLDATGGPSTREHRHAANWDTDYYRTFDARLRTALAELVRPRDIILHPFGQAHKALVSDFPNQRHVEPTIGYDNPPFGAFRIFGSHAWRHYLWGKYGGEQSDRDRVIHHYYDGDEWTPREAHGDYLLYLGRVIPDKGLGHLKTLAELTGRPIRVVGQGEPETLALYRHELLDFRPPVTGRARDELLGRAQALIMPTRFCEPFGGVAVEAQMCGTPVIASAFGGMTESVLHGVTGWHFHTAGDMVAAVRRTGELDRGKIARLARERFGFESRAREYDKAFRVVQESWGPGWFTAEDLL